METHSNTDPGQHFTAAICKKKRKNCATFLTLFFEIFHFFNLIGEGDLQKKIKLYVYFLALLFGIFLQFIRIWESGELQKNWILRLFFALLFCIFLHFSKGELLLFLPPWIWRLLFTASSYLLVFERLFIPLSFSLSAQCFLCLFVMCVVCLVEGFFLFHVVIRGMIPSESTTRQNKIEKRIVSIGLLNFSGCTEVLNET